MSIEAQSCRSIWDGIAVKHLKEYRRNDAEGSEVTLEPTEEVVKITILYRTLIKVVELYVDGRMFQGDASALTKGGWTFKLSEEEEIRAIAGALVMEHELKKAPRALASGDEGVYVVCDEASIDMWREEKEARRENQGEIGSGRCDFQRGEAGGSCRTAKRPDPAGTPEISSRATAKGRGGSPEFTYL